MEEKGGTDQTYISDEFWFHLPWNLTLTWLGEVWGIHSDVADISLDLESKINLWNCWQLCPERDEEYAGVRFLHSYEVLTDTDVLVILSGREKHTEREKSLEEKYTLIETFLLGITTQLIGTIPVTVK